MSFPTCLIRLSLKSVLSDAKIATIACCLGLFVRNTFSFFHPEVISILHDEVCFLDAAKR